MKGAATTTQEVEETQEKNKNIKLDHKVSTQVGSLVGA